VSRNRVVSNVVVRFFSVIVIILNVQLCVLTGVEPGTGLDGMYVIADILAVAMVVLTCLLRSMRENDNANEDERSVEINQTYIFTNGISIIVNTCKKLINVLHVPDACCSTRQTPDELSQQLTRNQKTYTYPFP
jgi:hypothetical protein